MVHADSDHVKSKYCSYAECQNGTSHRRLYASNPREKHTCIAQVVRQISASKSIGGIGFRHRQEMNRHLYLDEVQSSDNSLQGEVES